MRRNLRSHPQDKTAYVWNSTYDNVTGTFAVKSKESTIQDVSHGNHVVSYIVAAYELGKNNWNSKDIQRLCNTVKVIYKQKENRFADNVDGSEGTSRSGWRNFQADGWVKLSRYNTEVNKIFQKFARDSRILKRYNQEFQFKANWINAIRFHEK